MKQNMVIKKEYALYFIFSIVAGLYLIGYDFNIDDYLENIGWCLGYKNEMKGNGRCLHHLIYARYKNYRYQMNGISYKENSVAYSPVGHYLNIGRTHSWNAGEFKLDREGIPMVSYEGVYKYNPVTIAQYALALHGRSIDSGVKNNFPEVVSYLLNTQDKQGAFRFNFEYKHYTKSEPYGLGWISGMAQGNALSAIARLYALNPSIELLDSGNRATRFLTLAAEQGGPLTTLRDLHSELSGMFWQEYVTEPNVYTLNGFMFTLLGLYDWCSVSGYELACDLYNQGLSTLLIVLPYYDIGYISSYDLSHITHNRILPRISPKYHSIHINLLTAIVSISDQPVLKRYLNRWIGYVE